MRVGRPPAAAVLTSGFAVFGLLWGGFLGVRQMAGVGSVLDRFENLTLDWRFLLAGAQPAPRGVVIAAIDDETVREAGAYPLPRSVLARIVRGVAAFNPQAIALDIAFVDAGQPEADFRARRGASLDKIGGRRDRRVRRRRSARRSQPVRPAGPGSQPDEHPLADGRDSRRGDLRPGQCGDRRRGNSKIPADDLSLGRWRGPILCPGGGVRRVEYRTGAGGWRTEARRKKHQHGSGLSSADPLLRPARQHPTVQCGKGLARRPRSRRCARPGRRAGRHGGGGGRHVCNALRPHRARRRSRCDRRHQPSGRRRTGSHGAGPQDRRRSGDGAAVRHRPAHGDAPRLCRTRARQPCLCILGSVRFRGLSGRLLAQFRGSARRLRSRGHRLWRGAVGSDRTVADRLAADRTRLAKFQSPLLVEHILKTPRFLERPVLQDVAVVFLDLSNFTGVAESLGPQWPATCSPNFRR